MMEFSARTDKNAGFVPVSTEVRAKARSASTRLCQLVRKSAGWKAVRSAVDTINTGLTQADIFGDIAPRPPAQEMATLADMERRIEQVSAMVARGWRNGECIVAARVNLDRTGLMADKIDNIQKALRVMARELRNTAAQGSVALDAPREHVA